LPEEAEENCENPQLGKPVSGSSFELVAHAIKSRNSTH
jgi:hypothetical protein